MTARGELVTVIQADDAAESWYIVGEHAEGTLVKSLKLTELVALPTVRVVWIDVVLTGVFGSVRVSPIHLTLIM